MKLKYWFILGVVLIVLLAIPVGFQISKKEPIKINGKLYYVHNACLSTHSKTEYTYHLGYSYRGKYEYYFGPETTYKCLEYGNVYNEVIYSEDLGIYYRKPSDFFKKK